MPNILPSFIESSDAAGDSSTTYNLAIGQTAQGIISTLGDHDWYRLNLVAGQTYTFAADGTGTNSLRDTYIYLHNAAGAVLGFDDDSGPGISSSLTFTATTTGTYYLDVGSYADETTGQYGVTATAGTHPNFDIPMGAGAIDAYASWTTPGTPAVVTYGFRASPATYTTPGSNTASFTQVSPQEMAAVQSILQYYSEICNITFVQVNPGGYTDNATILIGNYSDPSDGAGAFAYYPGSTASTDSAGDLWLNLAGGVSTTSNPLGSYSFFAIMHELGHAMGLSHPGDYNAGPGVSITYQNSAQFVQDSEQYSVMSYFGGSATGESPGNFATAETPMMFDIYELQQLYGANMTTRTGDTTYGFGSNAGTVYDFAQNAAPNFCIWDAGGVDTLNCSGYTQSQLINLNAGTFSNVGGETANISIALNVTMENAVGGSGNDTIIGNEVANRLTGGNGADNISGGDGNDVLIGGLGNDTLDGGNGTDQAVFAGLRSAYTLTDLGGGSVRVVGPDGTDTLTNIEQLVFDDQTVNWSTGQASVTLSNVTASIAENTSTATHIKVADITIGGDTTGTATLGLSGADAASFELIGNTLYVKSGTVLDFESKTSYAVTVTATVGGTAIASTGYTLGVGDLNDNAPVVTTAATQTVAENTVVVAALTSTDADTVGTNPATFSITGGADSALFNVVGGNLVFRNAPDYETGPHSYVVQVSAFDGVNTTAKTITVNLTDTNDNAPVITTNATQTVAENTTVVAALASTDADTVGTNPATFSITGGANQALFNVVGGNLVFRTAPDYETGPHSYQVQVSAFDGVNTTAKTITVNVTDVNDNAPVITTNATLSVVKNTTLVAALTSTDADTVGTNPATFSITGGANSALFDVVAGNLVFRNAPNYATDPHSYVVQVSAFDGANTTIKTLTVNLTDVNNFAPVITTAATQSIPENSTVVAALTSTDADDPSGTTPATFSITGGANAALFDVVAGNLVFRAAPDYETNPHTYQVQVSAFDGIHTTAEAITVNVTDVDETPPTKTRAGSPPVNPPGNNNPPVITTAATQTVAENTTVVAALTSTDVDTVGTNPATFSVTGGANSALFNVVGGNLVFRNAPDYETGPHSYVVQVSAFDGVNTTAKTITVNVTDTNDNAPVVTTAATQTVAENTVVVAALTSTDADTVGTNPATFSITGGADSALFNVTGGNLVFRNAPDYETGPHSYVVQVSAFDGVNTTAKTITVNVTDTNDNAPVVTTAATQTVAENTTVVAALTSTDADTVGTNPATFSITGGANSALFNVVGGNLVFRAAPDYETGPHSYVVQVSAFDGVNTTAKTITVNVTDANDNAPVVTTAATQTVAENTTVVAALTSTDADTVGTNPATFSITGGANAALFNIVAGNLVFRNAPDYETGPHSYVVQVSAFDGVNTTAKTITVNLTDVNDNAPVITTASTLSVVTNTTLVAALTSTDADTVGTNPATFSITGGANSALFDVVAGNLVFRTAPNYATDPHSYVVQVSAFDGVNTTAQTLTVNLTDVNNSAPFITTAASQTVAENSTVVAALTSTDADDPSGTTPATFSITGGANAALFDIVAGNLVFRNAPDYETGAHSYVVQVSAFDGVHTTAKTITVNLTDVNDNAPVVTTAATQTVAENTTLVAALTSTDADTVGTNPATFSITGGANAALFNIVAGNLVFRTAPDYETGAHSYVVQVSAFDGVHTTAQTITVNLTDVNDNAPVITTAATQSMPENQTVVTALTSTDADTVGTNPATFSITGGANSALFNVVGGNLVFRTAPDYETNPHTYQVQVSAFDGIHTTAETITVNVTDVDETSTPPTKTRSTHLGADAVHTSALPSLDNQDNPMPTGTSPSSSAIDNTGPTPAGTSAGGKPGLLADALGADHFVFDPALGTTGSANPVADSGHLHAGAIDLDHFVFAALPPVAQSGPLYAGDFHFSTDGAAHPVLDQILANVVAAWTAESTAAHDAALNHHIPTIADLLHV